MFNLFLNLGNQSLAVPAASGGFRLDDASYASKSKSVTTEAVDPRGMCFGDSGTKMYVSDNTTHKVFQYTLSTAWDVSTASYASRFKDLSPEVTNSLRGISWNDDGTKFYACSSNSDSIHQYVSATPWDIQVATTASKSLSVAAQDTAPVDIHFSPDGVYVYVCGGAGKDINRYTMSTPWDISTGSYDHLFNPVEDYPYSIQMNLDGTKMFIAGALNTTAYQYSLSTAYDVTSSSYDSISFDLSSEVSQPYAIRFSTDGTSMFLLSRADDTVYQYNTP